MGVCELGVSVGGNIDGVIRRVFLACRLAAFLYNKEFLYKIIITKKSQKHLCAIDSKSIGIYQMVLWFYWFGF